MKNRVLIGDMYRAKNKQSFFALHQIIKRIHDINPECEIVLHILWDNKNELPKDGINWAEKIQTLVSAPNIKLHSYDREFFLKYLRDMYKVPEDTLQTLHNFPGIFTLLILHYLRRVCCEHYFLVYNDDILLNCDFKEIYDAMVNQIPVLIEETMNSNCDKCLFQKLTDIYQSSFLERYTKKNPQHRGFNGGFEGINLGIFDDFLSPDRFQLFLALFDFRSIYDSTGKEIMGNVRFHLDTQQQSFLSLLNICLSEKHLFLNPKEYFVIPNWGHHPIYGNLDSEDENQGWDGAMNSKIVHFIGHTFGKGKPAFFFKCVDEYLKNEKQL